MRRMIWIMGLWLVGTGNAHALTLEVPETLKYNVYWGFMRVGSAQLDYVPGPGGYVLRARVKDDSSLIDMDDSWESRGSHTADKPFMPRVYSVKQAENSYRADKTMTFDAKGKVVTYVNNIDPSDKVEPLVLTEARDVLATVYAWRLSGVDEVKKAAQVPMVSLKKMITLQRAAGERTGLKLGTRELNVWRVQLKTVKDNGKASKDAWTVYLKDDATLAPVQIIASTKFGTFRASIDE